jgi:hypothetical protein
MSYLDWFYLSPDLRDLLKSVLFQWLMVGLVGWHEGCLREMLKVEASFEVEFPKLSRRLQV